MTWSSSVGAEPEPVAVGVGVDAATVDHHLRAGLARRRRGRRPPCRGAPGHQRAHVAAAAAVAGAQGGDPLGDLRDQLVGDRFDGDERRDGHAALAGGAEAGVDGGVGGQVEVGVGQHDHVVLGAAEGLHPLAVRGAGLVDVAGDRSGADERNRLDVGVLEEPVDGLLVAVHDVEHAVGQAGLAPQLGEPGDADGSFSLGLRTTVLPAAMAIGNEPQRHHGREVEGGDDRDHAERLADRVDVDAGRDVLGEPALEQVRDAAGELHDLEAAGDLAQRRRREPCRARR